MYSVLLYRDTLNPDNVPGDWPAEADYIPDGPDVAVNPPCMLMTNEEYTAYVNDTDRKARKEAWNQQQQGVIAPVALIKVDDVTCEINHILFAWDKNIGKIRVPVTVPFSAHILIRDLGDNVTLPINDVFAMPIIGENRPTSLWAVVANEGVITLTMAFNESGIYEINEQTINRELPPGGQFKFTNIKIYVVDV